MIVGASKRALNLRDSGLEGVDSRPGADRRPEPAGAGDPPQPRQGFAAERADQQGDDADAVDVPLEVIALLDGAAAFQKGPGVA